MRHQGRLTDWNDGRGFGFITPSDGGATVFAHVSEFPSSQRRPMVTDLVTYVLERDERGRPRATDVQFLAPTRAREPRRDHARAQGSTAASIAVALGFFALLAVAGAFNQAAWVVLAVDIVLSAATLFAYRLDKRAAQEGRWRTEESALHLMALLGGWPGALVAQQRYRHKTRKLPFQVVFWLTVIVNLGVTAWLLGTSAPAGGPLQ